MSVYSDHKNSTPYIKRLITIDGFEYPLWELIGDYGIDFNFNWSDVVIDIGAHRGQFSMICARKGAGTIIGYDISILSLSDAQFYCRYYPQIKFINKAVWKPGVDRIKFKKSEEGYLTLCVLDCLDSKDSDLVGDTTIEAISLDEILAPFETIRFLKMDCEGSEYEILMNCNSLHKVQQMSLEVHKYDGFPQYDPLILAKYLSDQGFELSQEFLSDKGLSFIRTKRRI